MIIYFNPECSKCKETLDILHSNHCDVELRNYLEIPPNENEIRDLLDKLGCKAIDLVRKTEVLYLEKFALNEYSEEEWVKLLSLNPVLLQRPIVIDGSRAIIGRPPVLVLDLVNQK